MSRHYSSSKVFYWIREKIFKIEKPSSLGLGQWKKWDDDLKKSRPFAFFMTETLPDWLEWIPSHSVDYINNIRYYVSNRVNASHRLDSSLTKGKYHEFSNRMLYSAFDSFIDFIETEEASMHIAFKNKEERKKYKVPFWRRYWFLRWGKAWRCEEAAVDHLKWEMTLDKEDPNDPHWVASTYQAVSAREKMALYTWWKHIRPARGEAWVASGFQAFWDKMDAKYGDNWLGLGSPGKLTAAEHRMYRKLQEENDELEQRWEDEDTEMLVRLVKIRQSLWT